MKTKKSLLVLLAITLMLALVFAACGDGGDSSNNTETDVTNGGIAGSGGTPEKPVGNVYLGETLTLSGQVYTLEGDDSAPIFKPFTGNLQDLKIFTVIFHEPVPLGGNGNGAVTNGRLNYTIGKPESLVYVYYYFDGWDSYSDVQYSRNDVKGFLFGGFDVPRSEREGVFLDLEKIDYQVSISGNTYSAIGEEVYYIYVEEDIIISGKGKTETFEDGSHTFKTNDFSIALKKGWNAVYYIQEGKGTFSGNSTYTESVFLSNPPLKWVLFGAFL